MAQLHPIAYFFSDHHPMSRFIKCDFTGSLGGKFTFSTTAPAGLVRNLENGELHSGFACVLLDTIMGGAVMGVLTKVQPIATIGMSIQHLRRPVCGEQLFGSASCGGVQNDVAFVTAELTSADNEILAIASGTFMLGTRNTSIRNRIEGSRL